MVTSTKSRLLSLAGLVLGLIAVGFVVATLIEEWPRVSAEVRAADVTWLAAGVVAAVAAMTTMAWGWQQVLAVLGVSARPGRVIAWYYVGELGKYLPGGVWPVLGRGELARRGAVPTARAYTSVGLSLAVLYLAAMFVAAAFLPFALTDEGFSPWMLCLLILPAGVALLHHRFLEWLVALVHRVTGRRLDVEIPRWGQMVRLIAVYVPTWLLVGASTWCIARAMDPGASFSRVMFSSVLSWIAGFLAVPVPTGAGVREAVMYATSGLDRGLAVATAVGARLVFLVVDLVGAAVSAAFLRRRDGETTAPR